MEKAKILIFLYYRGLAANFLLVITVFKTACLIILKYTDLNIYSPVQLK